MDMHQYVNCNPELTLIHLWTNGLQDNGYKRKKNTDLLQVVNFTSLLHLVNKLNLSISSSCEKSVKIRRVTTGHLQTCYNLLKQFVASLWITSFEYRLATSLLTTCNILVLNKLSQAMPTHSDIGLLITSLLQDVNRLIVTCAFLAMYMDAYFFVVRQQHSQDIRATNQIHRRNNDI